MSLQSFPAPKKAENEDEYLKKLSQSSKILRMKLETVRATVSVLENDVKEAQQVDEFVQQRIATRTVEMTGMVQLDPRRALYADLIERLAARRATSSFDLLMRCCDLEKEHLCAQIICEKLDELELDRRAGMREFKRFMEEGVDKDELDRRIDLHEGILRQLREERERK